MVHILDEGVPSFSFRLEGVEQVVPYDIREFLGFQKGASEQVDMHGGTCRVYSPGTHARKDEDTHARKDEDGLLLEFPCNPIRTRSM
jgi:hypothetical protein